MQLRLFMEPDESEPDTCETLAVLLAARGMPGDEDLADLCGNWWEYGPPQYKAGFANALSLIGGDSLPDSLRLRAAPGDAELATMVESYGATFPEVMALMWGCIEVLRKAVAERAEAR